jgi:hypothetical protein
MKHRLLEIYRLMNPVLASDIRFNAHGFINLIPKVAECHGKRGH